MEMGADYAKRKYKKELKQREEGNWNNEICRIGREAVAEAMLAMYSKPRQLEKLALISDLGFTILDEPADKSKIKGIEKFFKLWKINLWWRGAAHLIWHRADRGCWNRPLVEECWEKGHEVLKNMKEKDITFTMGRMGLDFAMIIADDDDPYYTMMKWWFCKARDKGIFELAKTTKTDNEHLQLFMDWLNLMDTPKIRSLSMDWNSDVCEAAANAMTKKDIIIGGPIEEKRKTARKNCPL